MGGHARVSRHARPPWPVPVRGCPCGRPHRVRPWLWARYRYAAAGQPATVTVTVAGRAWQVPHLFLFTHGARAADMPRLAAVYGWGEL